jgi:membrane protease YdiL (CAAX protease family)
MESNEILESPQQGDTPFITAPFKGKNAFWRYFLGGVIPFLVSNIIGAIPLGIVMVTYAIDGSEVPQKGGMPDFEMMGIDPNIGLLLLLFPFILAFFTMVLIIKPLHNRSFGTVVNGGRKVRWGRMLVSALVWTVISALWLAWSVRSDPDNFIPNNTSSSLIILAVIALLLIPFQAAYEEILFRGYLIQGFTVLTRNRWLPIVVTSILFGLMHALNPEVQEYGFMTMIPQYIFFGLVFAILTMLDDGIELAIGAHAANNVFLSIFLTHKDAALQTPAMYEQLEIYPWQEFAGLVAMSFLFIAVMAVVYRWKDIRRLYVRVVVSRASDAV